MVYRPDNGLHHLIQGHGDLLENGNQFRLDGGKTVQTTAVPTTGLNQRKSLQALNELASGHLQALLLKLTLEQRVGEQRNQVDEEHARDTLVLVQEEG